VVPGELGLERLDLGAEYEPPAVEYSAEGGIEGRPVAGHERLEVVARDHGSV
jgi:hypothetical protein